MNRPTWRRTRCVKPDRPGDKKQRGRLRRLARRAGALARGEMYADSEQLGPLLDDDEDWERYCYEKSDPHDQGWGRDQ